MNRFGDFAGTGFDYGLGCGAAFLYLGVAFARFFARWKYDTLPFRLVPEGRRLSLRL